MFLAVHAQEPGASVLRIAVVSSPSVLLSSSNLRKQKLPSRSEAQRRTNTGPAGDQTKQEVPCKKSECSNICDHETTVKCQDGVESTGSSHTRRNI